MPVLLWHDYIDLSTERLGGASNLQRKGDVINGSQKCVSEVFVFRNYVPELSLGLFLLGIGTVAPKRVVEASAEGDFIATGRKVAACRNTCQALAEPIKCIALKRMVLLFVEGFIVQPPN